jgi:hypothetical protein
MYLLLLFLGALCYLSDFLPVRRKGQEFSQAEKAQRLVLVIGLMLFLVSFAIIGLANVLGRH